MKTKFFFGLFLIVGAIVFAGFFTVFPIRGQKEKKDDATLVVHGQVTEKERVYSNEYKKLYSYHKGRKFSELIEESVGLGKTEEELGAVFGIPGAFFLPGAPEVKSSEFLTKLACKADAIVIGHPTSKVSHMTEDETFIYSAYEFLIQDVLKNNPLSPIKSNSLIDVTRPGGLIKLDSRLIRINDLSYESLQIDGTYLLFLKYVSAAQGYMPASPEADFVLENNSYVKLTKRPVPKDLNGKIRAEKLLTRIRQAVLIECRPEQTGENP